MECNQDFLSACRKGDLGQVQDFLGKELVSVNCTDDDDESTALQVAAANGHDAVVLFLLSRGALVDKANMYGWTPLMQAARHGHTAVVAGLLKNRACVNAKNKLGASSLMCATRSGHLSTVKMLLENGADVSSPSTEEFTALMVAVQYGYDSIVRLLIDKGCNVNHRAHSNGLNALMVAASNGHKSTAQILVRHGICLNTTNVCGKTALDIAILRGKRQIRCYLAQAVASKQHSENGARKCDIFEVAKSGDLEKVKLVISKNGSEVNSVRREDGATPLMLAAITGHLATVKFLVERGAQVDKQDTISGWTALMQAIFHGNNEVAQYLIQVGANVNLQANNGCTAFDIATLMEKSDANLIRILAQLTVFTSTIVKNSFASNNNKEVKDREKWWDRLSRHLNHPKLKRGSSCEPRVDDLHLKPLDTWKQFAPLTPNLQPKQPPILLSTPTIVLESRQSPGVEESKSPLLLLSAASPCRSAASSNALKQVVPPLLPSSGLDTSNPGRSTMPSGRKLESLNATSQKLASTGMQWHAGTSADIGVPSDFLGTLMATPGGSKSRNTTDAKDDLYDILQKWSLEHYYSLFEEQEVDREALAFLTESDLREMGIDSTVSREHLLKVIFQLKAGTFPN